MSWPRAGDHAVPGDQPSGGDRVGRGQPDQQPAGRTNQTMPTADEHPDDLGDDAPRRSASARTTPIASSTTSARIGQQQRLGVGARVDDDRLALVQQVLGDGHGRIMSPIAHALSDVDDIAGAHRGALAAVLDQQPPARVDAGRGAGERLARRQVDADLAGRPWRRPRRTTRPAASRPGRRPPATRCRTPTARRAARPSSVGPVGHGRPPSATASEVASGTGSSSAVMPTLSPMPDDRRRPGVGLDPLDQDPGHLPAVRAARRSATSPTPRSRPP